MDAKKSSKIERARAQEKKQYGTNGDVTRTQRQLVEGVREKISEECG
jgi:hypothetical protein